VIDDPEEVIVDFRESKISDMSAIDAVHKLTERYAKAGKKLHLRYLC
jgi:SulP family sulfate permease